MAIINTATWAKDLEAVMRTWFSTSSAGYPDIIPTLYNVTTTQRAEERLHGMSGIGTDVFKMYKQSGAAARVGPSVGYEKIFRMWKYGVDIPIEKSFIDDGSQVAARARSEDAFEAALRFMQVEAASVFNNAFSTTYAGPDGAALVSDSHPGSKDNKLTLALNAANLETAKQLMYAFTDDTDDMTAAGKIGAIPDTLIVPPALESVGRQLTGSQLTPENANNSINPFSGMRLIVMHYLTSSTDWFIVDSRLMKKHLLWVNRQPWQVELSTSTAWEAVYALTARYDYGFTDWRWIVGSDV